MNTHTLVRAIKADNSDFEWFPTTKEMLSVIRDDMSKTFNPYNHSEKLTCSVLDCGAGNGSALMALTEGKRYAIEISKPLIQEMDKSIFIVGTDFEQQVLIDKKVHVVFCNPPYSEFSKWATKIIREANAESVYLVIPKRWENDANIKLAIESRKATVQILYQGDFLNAPRAARAKIDIIKVSLSSKRNTAFADRFMNQRVDPFKLWFNSNFHFDTHNSKQSEFEQRKAAQKKAQDKLDGAGELITSQGLVKTLEQFYFKDMDDLMNTYIKLNEIDSNLLRELNVSIDAVREGLELKIHSLKDMYWHKLFDGLSDITEKLCSFTRKKLLEQLTENTHLDFTAQNAYAVAIWVIKHANHYLDDQVVTMMEKMTESANVRCYKSNQRTFGRDAWRYRNRPVDLDCYGLDYRIVLTSMGGIYQSQWASEQTSHNLHDSAKNMINDLLTLGANLGFDTRNTERAESFIWESNKKQIFNYYSHAKGQTVVLFEARAFKNGSIHIKFNQNFMMAMNVEFGRLKGWLKSKEDVIMEMNDIPVEFVAQVFGKNLQLTNKSSRLLLVA
ncbi:hypothetical protein ABT56_19160 [Photobacterium aquae]|uniref:DUF4942 domain-containing protein n=1 Tax=Photobacterium aquae TaxID=1195763 RepID=A0A0J1GUX7_9GAMM|nr:DUF4942 domain-containing protein [Photobacterium aquae]KLV03548.1 hypothetical protein ABT56_19160 [Photobacterium aquae]